MAKVGDLVVRVLGDNAQFDSAVDKSKTKFENFAKSAKKIGDNLSKAGRKLTTFVTLPILGLGAAFVKAAADAEETNSKFNVVFRDQADAVRKWAKEFAGATGRSTIENIKFLASVQDLFVPLGVSRDKAADLSKSVVTLATDMSSFNNLPTADVIRDIQSALVGNHETVRKYGVVLDEATVNQELLTMGIEGGNKAATAAEKALARLNLIMAGTTDAQGDAIRTADSFTNRFRALKSSITDLAESFGNLLLPTIQKLVEGITKAVKFVDGLDESQKRLIITIAGLAAAVGPLLIVVGKMLTLFAAMSGPAGWITLAVVAVVALGIAIWDLNSASEKEKKLDEEILALKEELTKARGEERIAILEITLAKQKERIESIKTRKVEEQLSIERGQALARGRYQWEQTAGSLEKINKELEEASSEYALLAQEIKFAYESQRISNQETKEGTKAIEEQEDSLSRLNDEYKGGVDDLQGWISGQTEVVAGFKEMTQAQLQLTGLMGQFIDTLGGASEATFGLKKATDVMVDSFNTASFAGMEFVANVTGGISEAGEKMSVGFTDVLNSTASAFSSLGSISSQFYENRGIEIDNDYARRKAAIEANILDEEARETALSDLDEEFDTKRKQLQRDQAIASRTTGIFDAILNTTGAIMQTFKTFGFPLGVPFAAIMGALGAAKVAAIASQPLPELAKGGIIREPTVLLAGERGPEKITPLGEEQPIIIGISIDGQALNATITKNVRNRRILIDKGALTI